MVPVLILVLPVVDVQVFLDDFIFSEINLAVAAYISDTVIDGVIETLTDSHKTLVTFLCTFYMRLFYMSAIRK